MSGDDRRPDGLSGAPILRNRGKQGRPGALPRLPQGHRHRDFKIAHEPQNRLGRAEPEFWARRRRSTAYWRSLLVRPHRHP